MNSCRGYEESGRDVQIPSDGHAVDDWGFAALWHAASATRRDDRFQQRKRVHGLRDDRESESRRSSGRHHSGRHHSGRRRGCTASRLGRFNGRLRHWRAIRQSEFPLVDGKSSGCVQETWESLWCCWRCLGFRDSGLAGQYAWGEVYAGADGCGFDFCGSAQDCCGHSGCSVCVLKMDSVEDRSDRSWNYPISIRTNPLLALSSMKAKSSLTDLSIGTRSFPSLTKHSSLIIPPNTKVYNKTPHHQPTKSLSLYTTT